MTSLINRVNGPPTAEELLRLHAFISKKQQEIRDVTLGILNEEQTIVSCQNAVNNLDEIIKDVTDALNLHTQTFTAYNQISTRFVTIFNKGNWEVSEERHIEALSSKTSELMKSLSIRGYHIAKEQGDAINQEIRELESQLSVLQNERDGWDFSLRLSQDELQNYQDREKRLKRVLESAKISIAPIRKVPYEIWAEIFSFRVEEDLVQHLNSKTETFYKPTVLALSQVCRPWRRVIETEPHLWHRIPAYSINEWSIEKKQLLDRMLQVTRSIPEFIVHPADTCSKWLKYRNYPGSRKSSGYNLTTVDDSALSGRSYSLTIIYPANGSDFSSTISNIPFCQPKSLTLRIQSAAGNHYYDIYPLQYFTGVSRLTLVGFQSFQTYQISSLIPHLKYLSFDLTTFNSFDLQPHIPANLEELHLRHHGLNANRFTLSREVNLQKLVTLGVTPYELELFKTARLPALQKLVIYSPQSHPEISLDETLVSAALLCKRLQSVELQDWTKREVPAGSTTGWTANSILREILKHASTLKDVKFFKCFVDGVSFIQVLSAQSECTKNLAVTLDQCSGITRQDCEEIMSGDTVSIQKFCIFV